MLDDKILEILKKIEFRIKEIKDLHKYWNLDTYKLINDSKVLLILASKLYKKINDYYH